MNKEAANRERLSSINKCNVIRKCSLGSVMGVSFVLLRDFPMSVSLEGKSSESL